MQSSFLSEQSEFLTSTVIDKKLDHVDKKKLKVCIQFMLIEVTHSKYLIKTVGDHILTLKICFSFENSEAYLSSALSDQTTDVQYSKLQYNLHGVIYSIIYSTINSIIHSITYTA